MALAEGGVRYTFAHAFTPKIPRAMTSIPTTRKGGNHQTFGAAWKFLELGIGAAVRKLPDEKRQDELGDEEGNPGLGHGLRHLLIDQRAMGRDVLRRIPGVPKDRNRGQDRDYDDCDCKEFSHDPSPSADLQVRLHACFAVPLRLSVSC